MITPEKPAQTRYWKQQCLEARQERDKAEAELEMIRWVIDTLRTIEGQKRWYNLGLVHDKIFTDMCSFSPHKFFNDFLAAIDKAREEA